jgi:hypothetical protein
MQSDIPDIEHFSRCCYYVGLGLGGIALVLIFIVKYSGVDILHIFPPCEFFTTTSYYCFGCGGTRAVKALLSGHILDSFHYHPFVIYTAGVYLLYMITHTLNLITDGKIKAMIFRPGYFYFGAVLIIGQCLIKNFLLWKYDICI